MPCGYQAFVRLSSASQRKPPRRPWARRAAHGAPKPRPNGSIAAVEVGEHRGRARRAPRRAGRGLLRSRRRRNGVGSIGRSPRAGGVVATHAMVPGPRVPLRAVSVPPDLPIRRNTALLAASLAANSGMLQLSAAVASLTLVAVVGVKGLLGLGPAIVLASGALAALPAGRAMDRFGRVPVLAAGFGGRHRAAAAAGGARQRAAVGAGGAGGPRRCVGAASGTALLARTAAGDMYPPERRAHGIALVLFGAVFGAILGPFVFSPLLAGRELDGDALAGLWLAAGGFMIAGLVLVLAVRPDPRRIAELLRTDAEGALAPAAPLRRDRAPARA